MGAQGFVLFVHGKDLQEAVRKAADQDRWEYGHDAYSGTIGQKSGAVEFTPKRMPRGQTVTPRPYMSIPADDPGQPQPYVRSGAMVLSDLIELGFYDEEKRKKLEALFGERETERLLSIAEDKWSQSVAAIKLSGSALAREKKRLGIDGTHQKVWLVVGSAAC
jgi:hypothetical protein